MLDENIVLVNKILDFCYEPAMSTREIGYVDEKGMPEDTEQDRFDIAVFIVTIRHTLNVCYDSLKNYADINGLVFNTEKESITNINIGNVLE